MMVNNIEGRGLNSEKSQSYKDRNLMLKFTHSAIRIQHLSRGIFATDCPWQEMP